MTKSRQRRDGIAEEMRSCFDHEHGHEPAHQDEHRSGSAGRRPQLVAGALVALAFSIPVAVLLIALTY